MNSNNLIIWKTKNVLNEEVAKLEVSQLKELITEIATDLKKHIYASRNYTASMQDNLSKPYIEIRTELIEILNNEIVKRK